MEHELFQDTYSAVVGEVLNRGWPYFPRRYLRQCKPSVQTTPNAIKEIVDTRIEFRADAMRSATVIGVRVGLACS
jgi:hypothetical protein